MFRIFACAYGLRTMSMNSMPGNLTSSMYLPMPRRNRGSSLRLTLWPMPPRVADASGMGCLLHRFGLLLAHLRGAVLDGFDDIHVARTTAQVAADPAPNLGLARVGVAGQKGGRGHDHPWRAEATLQSVLLPEALLERIQLAVLLDAFDRLDPRAVDLRGQGGARLDGVAVEQHRARAAVRGVAADMSARQTERFADEVHQQQARFDVFVLVPAVNGDRDSQAPRRLGGLAEHQCPPRARSRARLSARRVSSRTMARL